MTAVIEKYQDAQIVESPSVTPFSYGDWPVRVVTVDGDPWWVAKDVCDVLDIAESHRALAALDDDEKGRHSMTTPGGVQLLSVISEAGLYSLILRSRKPEAKAFKRWVTHEVIPSIRRTGSYGARPALTEDEIVHQALAISARRVEELTATVSAQAEQLAIEAPKVRAYEALMDSDGTYSIAAAAQILGTGQNRLFAKLRELRILIPTAGSRYNTPYQEHAHLFDLKASTFKHSDGRREATYTTKVRPSGLEFIAKKIGVLL